MKVYEFISKTNWCQKALCKDVNGQQRHWPYGGDAHQWCLTGMILYCYRDKSREDILYMVTGKVGNIAKWNDSAERTWEQVRDLARELDI